MNIIRLAAIMAVYLLGMAVPGNCGPVTSVIALTMCKTTFAACFAAAGGAGGIITGNNKLIETRTLGCVLKKDMQTLPPPSEMTPIKR